MLAIQQVLGVKFKPWESRLLLRLSREYKGEMHAATSVHEPPPWPEAGPQWRWVQNWHLNKNLDKAFK